MARTFMKVLGAVLVLVGIVGFFIPFTGLLDLTFTHNLIHLVTGIAALAVSGSSKNSVLLAKVFGVVYLLVGVLGLFVTDVMVFSIISSNLLNF
jgi:preprotein translocase subunit Sss1